MLIHSWISKIYIYVYIYSHVCVYIYIYKSIHTHTNSYAYLCVYLEKESTVNPILVHSPTFTNGISTRKAARAWSPSYWPLGGAHDPLCPSQNSTQAIRKAKGRLRFQHCWGFSSINGAPTFFTSPSTPKHSFHVIHVGLPLSTHQGWAQVPDRSKQQIPSPSCHSDWWLHVSSVKGNAGRMFAGTIGTEASLCWDGSLLGHHSWSCQFCL